MKGKVVVIGLGHLGAHVMEILALRGIASELVGIDHNKRKEWGEIQDLADMMPYLDRQTQIRRGCYEDLVDADIAVLTACGKICDEDRLQELSGSIAVIDQILPEVKKNHFHGTMIVLTNPCDLISYYVSRQIDGDVIGTGTSLDSARLCSRIARTLHLAPSDIHGCCIGEHGDSQTILWSQTRAGNVPVEKLLTQEEKMQIEKDTIRAGCEIALHKGSTEFGIGMAACQIIQAILRDEHRIIPCSVDPKGAYGQSGFFTSIPCIISKEGARPMEELELSESERNRFIKSCEMLKAMIKEQKIDKESRNL